MKNIFKFYKFFFKGLLKKLVYSFIFFFYAKGFTCFVIFSLFSLFFYNVYDIYSIYLFPEYMLLSSILCCLTYYIFFLFRNLFFRFLTKNQFISMREILRSKKLIGFRVYKIHFLDEFNFAFIILLFCTLFGYIFLLYLLWSKNDLESHLIVYNSIRVNGLLTFIKIIILLCYLPIYYYVSFASKEKFKPEFYIILNFLIFFILIGLNSFNFMFFFLISEAYSICLLILIGLTSKSLNHFYTSLKYFILSSISSILMLLGITIFYGLYTTLSFKFTSLLFVIPFDQIGNEAFKDYCEQFLILTNFGLILFMLGFFLKFVIVPFHFWVFEIYETISYGLFVFISTCSKLFFFSYLFIFFYRIFLSINEIYFNFFIWFSLFIMFFSSLLILQQVKIRRFLICSGLFNFGVVLFIFSLKTYYSNEFFFLFLIFDSLLFCCFLLFLKVFELDFQDNNNLLFSKKITLNLSYKIILITFLFLFSGVPPFFLFFLKYSIIQTAFELFDFIIIIIFLTSSVLNSFAYFKWIKSLYFSNDHYLLESFYSPKLLNFKRNFIKNDFLSLKLFGYIYFLIYICFFGIWGIFVIDPIFDFISILIDST